MTNYIYKAYQFYEKFLSKDYFYLIAMSIYHIEILFFVTLLGIQFNTHTFLPMITPEHAKNIPALVFGTNSLTTFANFFMILIVLLLDFIFLYILKDEIKNYETKHYKKLWFSLSTKKILIIEFLILIISFSNPFIRAMIYFLSFNTIQIYVIYRILFNPKFTSIFSEMFRITFTLGSYISIISLLLYPIIVCIRSP